MKNHANAPGDPAVILTGMPAVVTGEPRVLVLGSMPGELSLRAGEYYANPQNRFWTLMEDILGVVRTEAYAQRTEALTAAGVALWDVLKHCSRPGSLDRRIDPATEEANDFAAFFRDHPSIVRIVLNGQKAARSFRRLVAPQFGAAGRTRFTTVVAPCTSPANARIGRTELTAAWRKALLCH
jgi:TDG/mug DNA glycosylase family protein